MWSQKLILKKFLALACLSRWPPDWRVHVVTFRKHTLGMGKVFHLFVLSVKIMLWFLNHKSWSGTGAGVLAVLHNLPSAHKFPLIRLYCTVEFIRPPVYSPVSKHRAGEIRRKFKWDQKVGSKERLKPSGIPQSCQPHEQDPLASEVEFLAFLSSGAGGSSNEHWANSWHFHCEETHCSERWGHTQVLKMPGFRSWKGAAFI